MSFTAAKDFVLDSSMTLAWCYEGEQTPQTQAVLLRLNSAEAFVPSLWPLEVTNSLLVGERRGRLTQAKVAQFVAVLESLAIYVDDQTPSHAFGQTLMLARAHALSTYDAAYLELALRRALPLASLDGDLIKAAQALGVPVL